MVQEFNYMTIEEVAELLKVARSTVYKFKGMGLPFIKIGKTVRFEKDDVLNWISGHKTCELSNK
jgi:excisionase family DNA binding protein